MNKVIILSLIFASQVLCLLESDSICDPVGTKALRHVNRFISGRNSFRCLCEPGFYGERCERIHTCVSGRARNISCTSPPQQMNYLVQLRCSEKYSQDTLEVCECFPGYKGHRCDIADYGSNFGLPHVSDQRSFDRDTVVSHPRSDSLPSWHLTAAAEHQTERTMFWLRIFLGSLLVVAVLGLILMCFMFSAMRLSSKEQMRKHVRETREVLLQNENNSMKAQAHDGPPSYEEIENGLNESINTPICSNEAPPTTILAPIQEIDEELLAPPTRAEPEKIIDTVKKPYLHV